MCLGCQGYGPRQGTIQHREDCTPHIHGISQYPCMACQTRPASAPITSHVGSKYLRTIRPADGVGQPIKVDIYAVLVAYAVTCPATQHGIKKLLAAGLRDKGSRRQDLVETLAAVNRAIELHDQSEAAADKSSAGEAKNSQRGI